MASLEAARHADVDRAQACGRERAGARAMKLLRIAIVAVLWFILFTVVGSIGTGDYLGTAFRLLLVIAFVLGVGAFIAFTFASTSFVKTGDPRWWRHW